MDKNQGSLIVFDLETGGLDPKRHPLIQLAAVAVDSALEPLEAIEMKVLFDERTATKTSLRKNHYERKRWAKDAMEPQAAAKAFAAFLRRYATCEMLTASGKPYRVAQLVAHNAAFDGPFLHTWYEKLGLYCPARYQVLCTLQRAVWYFTERPELTPPANYRLGTLCHYFGVPFHAGEAHEALADVVATVGLYRAIREHAAGSRPLSDNVAESRRADQECLDTKQEVCDFQSVVQFRGAS